MMQFLVLLQARQSLVHPSFWNALDAARTVKLSSDRPFSFLMRLVSNGKKSSTDTLAFFPPNAPYYYSAKLCRGNAIDIVFRNVIFL
jgi:hypothetical protein